MKTQVYLFQLTNDRSLVFRYCEFDGMVGETHFTQWCDLIRNDTLEIVGMKSKRRSVPYSIMKKWYKLMKGKSRRIEFHSHMKNFSPESIVAQDEETTADAISRVI